MDERRIELTGEFDRQEVKVHFVNSHSGTGEVFNGLSQVDADYALAQALQEQERAFVLARFKSTFSDYDDYDGSSSSSSVFAGDDEVRGGPPLGRQMKTDEAFARALQDAEDQEELVKMMSLVGLQDSSGAASGASGGATSGVHQPERNITQDDVDPDHMSYEELMALSEVVGSENKGLTSEEIAGLPVTKFKTKCCLRSSKNEHCVICYLEYEKGAHMITLPCKHPYHADCIRKWLEISKTCPICGGEVSVSKGKKTK